MSALDPTHGSPVSGSPGVPPAWSTSTVRVNTENVLTQNELRAKAISYERFPIRVAIDGGAGTGKSTFAQEVAKKYGCICFDTGLLYRAVSFIALNEGIRVEDEGENIELASKLDLEFHETDPNVPKAIIPHVIFRGGNNVRMDLTDALRTSHDISDIEQYASNVSKLPAVRRMLEPIQRGIGESGILAGRDIGTSIGGDVKILITADAAKRAMWRHAQESSTSVTGRPLDEIREAILARDKNDTERKVSPLLTPEAAAGVGYVCIDSTDMTPVEVLRRIYVEVDRALSVKRG